jgi:D-alanine transaminase
MISPLSAARLVGGVVRRRRAASAPSFSSSSSPAPLVIYLNGAFLPLSEAKVSVEDRGFLFSDGIYEVTKVYGTSGGPPHIFTEKEHAARMRRGMSELRFGEGGSSGSSGSSTSTQKPLLLDAVVDEVARVSRELLSRNGLASRPGEDATVYVQVTRGSAPRAHAFPPPSTPLNVFVAAKPFSNPPPSAFADGVAAVSTPDLRWARCDIKSVSLLPNILANQLAKERGAYECLLTRAGNIVEASHSNVFAVLDGRLVTHPLADNILPGITRGVLMARAREVGVEAVEAPIPVARLGDVTELFVTATTTEVMPIVRLDGKAVGGGKVGPVTRALREAWAGWVEEDRRAATTGQGRR